MGSGLGGGGTQQQWPGGAQASQGVPGTGQWPMMGGPRSSGSYQYGRGFGWPGSPTAYSQLPTQNPFMGGGMPGQGMPGQGGMAGIWQEGNPMWQRQNGGGPMPGQNPFLAGTQSQSDIAARRQLAYGAPGVMNIPTSGGSNPAAEAYQAARSQAGSGAGLNSLIATGQMGRNPSQRTYNQSMDPNTGMITRYAAPTSPVDEYLKDVYGQQQPDMRSRQSLEQASTYMSKNPGQFGLQDAWAGMSPEQMYQSAYYIQSHPEMFQNVGGKVSQIPGATPDTNTFRAYNYDPNAQLNVTGGRAVNDYADTGFSPNWDAVRQQMGVLQGIPGGDQFNLFQTGNAPADTRGPMSAMMQALAGGGSTAAPNTPEYMNESARQRDAAMANIFLGAQQGAINPEQAAFLNNMMGRSTQFGSANDPSLQAGNPFQYVMGNPGQNVSVTGGNDAAVTAQGASGAPGMPGANASPNGEPTPTPGTPEYQNWQYGYGSKPPTQQTAAAPSQQTYENAAQYMASNPQMFGFDPSKSAAENYQAAYYIQTHPEQFNMVQNPDGSYAITQR